MKRIKKKCQQIGQRVFRVRREDGSFSIEAVLGMSAILMITFLGIAYFTYLLPRQMITQEVQVLTQTAKMQGGFTHGDIEWFVERMEDRGIDGDEIEVESVAERRNAEGEMVYQRDVSQVEDLSVGFVGGDRHEGSLSYSPRNGKEVITIRVSVPSNNNFINAVSRYWSGDASSLGNYVFRETIMSERW